MRWVTFRGIQGRMDALCQADGHDSSQQIEIKYKKQTGRSNILRIGSACFVAIEDKGLSMMG